MLLAGLLLSTCFLAVDPPYIHQNDLPPRLEWNENYGYCGETSFIIAGLYYGQYCSQYTARSIASNGGPQYLERSQLVLGNNDDSAAQMMHLNYELWAHEGEASPPQADTDAFFVWIKQHVCLGHPVMIGLFNNEYLIYQDDDPEAGQPDYDHIVPVYGFGSQTMPINDGVYHGTDVIYFSDSGLYGDADDTPFLYNSTCEAFRLTREQANSPAGPIYSLIITPNHYGIAITGIQDDDKVTVPVRLKTSVNTEIPDIIDKSNNPPPAMPLTLTVAVENLDSSTTYNLYQYDDFTKVPTKNFNALAAQAKEKFVIHSTSGSYSMSVNIMSNDIVVFRAVPQTAP